MTSSLKERLSGILTIDMVVKVGTVCMCLLGMVALQGGLQRHWGELSHSEQRVAIMVRSCCAWQG